MEITATNENFAEIISANKLVLVDFWATWCGPCRMISPIISKLAEKYDGKIVGPTVETVAGEYEGKVTVVKCNVDDCEDIAVQYGIRNIPTLIFFKDGQPADKLVGNVPKAEITGKLDALL